MVIKAVSAKDAGAQRAFAQQACGRQDRYALRQAAEAASQANREARLQPPTQRVA